MLRSRLVGTCGERVGVATDMEEVKCNLVSASFIHAQQGRGRMNQGKANTHRHPRVFPTTARGSRRPSASARNCRGTWTLDVGCRRWRLCWRARRRRRRRSAGGATLETGARSVRDITTPHFSLRGRLVVETHLARRCNIPACRPDSRTCT